MKTEKSTMLTLKVPISLIRRLDKAAKDGARNRSSEVRARLERSLSEMPVFVGRQGIPPGA